MSGIVVIRWRRLLRYAATTVAFTLVMVIALDAFFEAAFTQNYRKDQIVASMQLLRDPVATTVHTTPPPTQPQVVAGRPALDRVRERGVLRVGYWPQAFGLSYTNAKGELVGFDVAMMHELARDLKVTLEFVPLGVSNVAEQLNSGYCDIALSNAITPELAQEVTFAETVSDFTMAFLVKDHLRDEFASWQRIRNLGPLRIATLEIPYFEAMLREALPEAQILQLQSESEYLLPRDIEPDALLYTAEGGSIISLINPQYAVVIPRPGRVRIPMAYAVARGDRETADFLNSWITLKKGDGTLQALYDYWILGKDAEKSGPRWSVISDVLHWTD